ncbi:MAG: tyrosine-type recombinase/integrase [Candidatus Omnitrophota bacterium]
MKLTKMICDKAEYKGKGKSGFFAVWDDELKGFGLRVTPNGRKCFVVSYRFKGRKKIVSLGHYGVLTVEQARQKAREYLVQVSQGDDPAEEKAKAARGTLMKDLAEQFMDNYSKPFKKSWKEDLRRINTYILPRFGKWNVSDIRRPDVIKFHSWIGKDQGKPYEANRVLALLSTMIEYACKIEMIESNHPNPCRKVDKFEEKSRDVLMPMESVPRLMQALETESNVFVRSAILLLILTGMRKTETLTLKWENIDLQRGEIRLPETKSGETQYIHLNEPAIELMKGIPRIQGNPYVFASSIEGKRLWELNRRWLRIRHEAGMDGITIHDLRRSVGSWLAMDGNSLYLVSKILRHNDVKTTEIYAHMTEDPKKAAMEKLGKKIVSIKDVRTAAEVKIGKA